jgi:hypothetical protein
VRTQDFISALVADHSRRRHTLNQRFVIMSALGMLAALCLYGVLLRPRQDVIASMASWQVAFKFLTALTLVMAAGFLALRQARPEPAPGIRLVLGPVLVVLALGVAAELATLRPASWGPSLVGSNAIACLLLIPVMSFAPLAAALAALRHGAPSRPPLAGAVAGLFAGGLGAALYATHCTDDSPLFVIAWYGLAVAIVAAAGAALGSKVLRW